MSAILTIKLPIQELRIIMEVTASLILLNHFVKRKKEIDVSDINAHYTRARDRSHRQDEKSSITMEHHFKIDLFTATIDV